MKRNLVVEVILLIFSILGLYMVAHIDRGYTMKADAKVRIESSPNGPILIKDEKPFYIKGASGKTYFKELAEIGGNTIRLYDTLNLKENLDNALNNNLAVIVDIPLTRVQQYYNPYVLPDTIALYKENITNVVNLHKDHPALLIWNLGNELSYPITFKRNDFIKVFNELIDLIHELDPDHPVGTSISGSSRGKTLSIHNLSPQLDIIGFNIFSNHQDLSKMIKTISWFTKLKPYYISEWGINGPWETDSNIWFAVKEPNSTEKSEIYKKRYKEYIESDSKSLGSLVFYWGYKVEGTPTWFNIIDEYGNTSSTYYTLKDLWTEVDDYDIKPPTILALNIDGVRANDSLIFNPKEIKIAEVVFDRENDSTLIFDWSIYKEGWGFQLWNALDRSRYFVDSLEMSEQNKIRFQIPSEEGPYRLFAKIYDQFNNFATINAPFYVMPKRHERSPE